MDRSALRARRHRDREDDEEMKAKQLRRRLLMWGAPAAALVLVGITFLLLRGSKHTGVTVFPEAQVRLDKLFAAYKSYCTHNRKAPANEQALRGYVQGMPATERDPLALPGNLDDLFVNPRDGQKYEVRWGLMTDPAAHRAVAWEKTPGQLGLRWVFLANGYFDLYSDEQLADLRK
jgi:hypothetical protein